MKSTEEGQGIITATSRLDVSIQPSRQAGSHRGQVRLRRDDGVEAALTVDWEVVANLRVTPPGLIVATEDHGILEKHIDLASRDVPFRVLGIEGVVEAAGLSELRQKSTRHSLKVRIDAEEARRRGKLHVTIRTDHPEGGRIDWSILALTP